MYGIYIYIYIKSVHKYILYMCPKSTAQSNEYIIICPWPKLNVDFTNIRDPFNKHGLILMSAWISHHILSQILEKIPKPFPKLCRWSLGTET